jgi:hypothetical protein
MIAPHFQGGAVFGAIDRVVAGLGRAAGSSLVLGRVRTLAERWESAASPRQRMAGGVVLLSAASVHLMLMSLNDAPPGWFWLILPGMAAAIGATLVASSFDARSRDNRG